MKRTNSAVWLEKYNRWQINVQKDNERKTFNSSIKGRTGQRECNKKADVWLEDNVVDANVRVTTLLDELLQSVEKRSSKSHHRKEKYHVDNFIRPAIGNKKISNITVQDLQSIIDSSYKHKQKDGETKTLSKKSLENIRATIMSFLKFCRKKSVTTLLPEDLSIPSGARNKVKSILQPNDIVTLFSIDTTLLSGKCVFDGYIYAYRFQVLTGLRPGELRGLKKSDINDGNVHIRRAINSQNEVTSGKNENAVRSFVLSPLALAVLNSQLETSIGEYVFDINSLSTYRHRWQKYCVSNNITVTSPYELRHTFVSIIKQLPEGKVKQLIGHSKGMDTFGTYGHEINGEGEETANDINEIFGKILKSVF